MRGCGRGEECCLAGYLLPSYLSLERRLLSYDVVARFVRGGDWSRVKNRLNQSCVRFFWSITFP